MRAVVVAQRAAAVVHPLVTGVALVCTTLGRWLELEQLFASVSGAGDLQIRFIVVDQSHVLNNSPLNDHGLDVIVLADSRRGISRGRNLGLDALVGSIPREEAASWLVGFPDDDVWFDAETIAAAARASTGFDFVSGALLCRDGTPSRAHWPAVECALDRWTLLGRTVEAATFIRLSAFVDGARFDERIGAAQVRRLAAARASSFCRGCRRQGSPGSSRRRSGCSKTRPCNLAGGLTPTPPEKVRRST